MVPSGQKQPSTKRVLFCSGALGTVGQCDQTSHRGLRGQSHSQQVELATLAHSTAVISHPHPHPVICQHEPGLARGLLGRSACPILSVRWAVQCCGGEDRGQCHVRSVAPLDPRAYPGALVYSQQTPWVWLRQSIQTPSWAQRMA